MRITKSLKHAGHGIKVAFTHEINLRIQLTAFLLVILAGIYLELSIPEWLAILTVSGLVMALELINTALEKVLDLIKPRFTDQAGTIKDMAAGAVLIASFAALIVACFIFIPRIILTW